MAVHKATDKKYIGQTVGSLERRKSEHLCEAKHKRYHAYFHSAIMKYGIESFYWQILYECNNIDDLNRMEKYYVKLYGTFENGYNLTLGGGGMIGYIPSDETRKRMSEAAKVKEFSVEQRRKMSESTKGKKNPQFGKRGKDSPNYGKTMPAKTRKAVSIANTGKEVSLVTRQKQSKAKRGKYEGKNNPAACAVIIKGKYFHTIKAAAKFLDVSHMTIYRKLKKQLIGYKYA